MPLVATEDVIAIRTALSIDRLDALLEGARCGVLNAGLVPRIDVAIHTSCPPGEPPTQVHFYENLDPSAPSDAGDEESMRCWPHTRLEFGGESLSAWGQPDDWYRSVQTIDRRFRSHAFGSLSGLAWRLRTQDFSSDANDHVSNLTNQSVGMKFFAPLQIRLRGVQHDREKQELFADIEMGPRVPLKNVRIARQVERAKRPH